MPSSQKDGDWHKLLARHGRQQAGAWLLLLDQAWAAGHPSGALPGFRLCRLPCGLPGPPQPRWEEAGPACSHRGPALCSPGLWVALVGSASPPRWCWHLCAIQAPGLAPDGVGQLGGGSPGTGQLLCCSISSFCKHGGGPEAGSRWPAGDFKGGVSSPPFLSPGPEQGWQGIPGR